MHNARLRISIAAIVLAAIGGFVGCNKPSGDPDEATSHQADEQVAEPIAGDPVAENNPAHEETRPNADKIRKSPPVRQTSATRQAVEPAAGSAPAVSDATMPKVLLTDGHAKTCLVKVGDTLPAIELVTLENSRQTLASLLGKRLTVVVFWAGSNPYAIEELGDLGPNVAEKYSGLGVNVVAINVRDSENAVQRAAQNIGSRLPMLRDPEGAALAKLATEKLPRTYLVDEHGKVLWFDLEYSRSTRRDLAMAIQAALGDRS